jgi:hypothetical protein
LEDEFQILEDHSLTCPSGSTHLPAFSRTAEQLQE